jgi:hypothetical protein
VVFKPEKNPKLNFKLPKLYEILNRAPMGSIVEAITSNFFVEPEKMLENMNIR